MATVVDHDIENRRSFPDVRPKRSAGLVTDKNLCPLVLVSATCFVGIDTVNTGALDKIVRPHPQTAAAVNSLLQHMDLSSYKLAEISVVNVKTVLPLPYPGPFCVRSKNAASRFDAG
ncbi:MAG TPA: hypothetical protein VGD78_12120 [Chthoniobacterales bacterium]